MGEKILMPSICINIYMTQVMETVLFFINSPHWYLIDHYEHSIGNIPLIAIGLTFNI